MVLPENLAYALTQVVHTFGAVAATGGVSFYYYGRLPDLHAIAAFALAVKLACAAGGFALTIALAARGPVWAVTRHRAAW